MQRALAGIKGRWCVNGRPAAPAPPGPRCHFGSARETSGCGELVSKTHRLDVANSAVGCESGAICYQTQSGQGGTLILVIARWVERVCTEEAGSGVRNTGGDQADVEVTQVPGGRVQWLHDNAIRKTAKTRGDIWRAPGKQRRQEGGCHLSASRRWSSPCACPWQHMGGDNEFRRDRHHF